MTRKRLNQMNTALKGACLCGSVQFKTIMNPSWVGICHCTSCRKATGGAINGACGFPKSSVNLKGNSLRYFESSPGVRRGFCSKCGTSLSYENALWSEDIHLMIGAFDCPELLEPHFHIFTKDQLSWMIFTDELVRYTTTPSNGDTQ